MLTKVASTSPEISPAPVLDHVAGVCFNSERQRLNGLQFADPFNGTPDVPETGDDTESQKDQCQPG